MGTSHNKKFSNNIYYQHNQKYFVELLNLVNKHPLSYFNMLNAKKYGKYSYLRDWINNEIPLLSDTYYKITTKCYWILHNIITFPKCDTCGAIITRNCGIRGYSTGESDRIHCQNNGKCANNDLEKLKQFEEYCLNKFGSTTPFTSDTFLEKVETTSLKKYGVKRPQQADVVKNKVAETCIRLYGVSCTLKADSVIKKIENTNLDRYGVKAVAQNHEIFLKQHQKYMYKNIHFDSSWELAYYIWLTDNNIDFTYQPNISFDYTTKKDNKKHKYFPDFLINGIFYEIKGDCFFNDNNEPIKYDKYPWFEKYDSMQQNNVQVLRFADIKHCLKYCDEKFNSKVWYRQFKTKVIST